MSGSISEILSSVFAPSLWYAALRYSTPIMYAGLCAALTQQAGILNIGTEGIMLMGAFLAVVGGYFTGSWIIGILVAMAGGVLIAWFIAVGNLRYRANMPAICTAMNLLVLGLTRFLLETMFGTAGSFIDPKIPPIPKVHLAFLDNIPVLNEIFNNWSLTEWMVILFVVLLYILLYKTTWGLHMRSVGRMEQAAQTAGINVTAIKYQAILAGGALGGLAGAHLSLGYSTMFVENMTNNRGFMGIAAMWFGNANPLGTVAGAYIFGFFDSVGNRLQPFGFPSQFVLAMPYLITIIVLAVVLWAQKRQIKRKKSSLTGLPAGEPT